MDSCEQLPNDVLTEIALRLPIEQLWRLFATSRRMAAICRHEAFWSHRIQRDFGRCVAPGEVAREAYKRAHALWHLEAALDRARRIGSVDVNEYPPALLHCMVLVYYDTVYRSIMNAALSFEVMDMLHAHYAKTPSYDTCEMLALHALGHGGDKLRVFLSNPAAYVGQLDAFSSAFNVKHFRELLDLDDEAACMVEFRGELVSGMDLDHRDLTEAYRRAYRKVVARY